MTSTDFPAFQTLIIVKTWFTPGIKVREKTDPIHSFFSSKQQKHKSSRNQRCDGQPTLHCLMQLPVGFFWCKTPRFWSMIMNWELLSKKDLEFSEVSRHHLSCSSELGETFPGINQNFSQGAEIFLLLPAPPSLPC